MLGQSRTTWKMLEEARNTMLDCLSRCEGQASRAGLGVVLLKSYGQWNNMRILLNADSTFLIKLSGDTDAAGPQITL